MANQMSIAMGELELYYCEANDDAMMIGSTDKGWTAVDLDDLERAIKLMRLWVTGWGGNS